MTVVFILLPLSLLLGGVFFLGYCWSVKTGQLEDLDTPALRMLVEDNDNAATTVGEKKEN